MAESKRERAPIAVVLIVLLLILLSLYVLSMGPACYLVNTGRLDRAAVDTFYHPVFWLCTKSKMLDALVCGYMTLWLPNQNSG